MSMPEKVPCPEFEVLAVLYAAGELDAEARAVVNRRCIECHSEQPTNHAFPIAPQGVMLDTALQMKQHARRIEARVAVERQFVSVMMRAGASTPNAAGMISAARTSPYASCWLAIALAPLATPRPRMASIASVLSPILSAWVASAWKTRKLMGASMLLVKSADPWLAAGRM